MTPWGECPSWSVPSGGPEADVPDSGGRTVQAVRTERARVLVVDDDADARTLARAALEEEGLAVVEAVDGEEALQRIRVDPPDLLVLDLGLPRRNGLDVLTEVRARSDLPVIVLTGRTDESDRVVGLRLGADDYLVKPFYPRELAARVEAVLRRVTRSPGPLDLGDLVIRLDARAVEAGGVPVDLTNREFELLAFLATHQGNVCSRAELLESVWGSSADWQGTSTVTEHIRRIRTKLGDAGRHLVTVHGVGYRFDP